MPGGTPWPGDGSTRFLSTTNAGPEPALVFLGITMTTKTEMDLIRLALPKGSMEKGVFTLLQDAGIRIRVGSRGYRPTISLPGYETKILRPPNIVEMIRYGSRDVGFTGADWVEELDATDKLVELLDTELNPVRLVAAAPENLLENGKLPSRPVVIASEYERLTQNWAKAQGLSATVVHTYGATEVFPPEDADCIVDNTATGSTLRENRLEIIDELMTSSTRMYANPKTMDNPDHRDKIESFVLVLRSVLDARKRVMLEVNVSNGNLDAIVELLPCMRKPTISPLYGEGGFAVKAAIPRKDLPILIPKIKALGGTDIVVTAPDQLVP